MGRRGAILLVAALWLGVAACGLAAPTAEGRPNIVVVMADDLALSQMGALRQTRTLLGGQGTTFTRSYAVQPLCCPSRASFLTGQYPHNHGATSNLNGAALALDDRETLPVWLRRAGYRTGYIGKYLNGYGVELTGIPPGWGMWQALLEPGFRYGDFRLYENGRERRYVGQHMTDVFAAKAERFIQTSTPRRPFFLTVAPFAPHKDRSDPAAPAPRHEGAYAGARAPRGPAFNEADVSDKPSFVRAQPRLGRAAMMKIDRQWRGANESLLAVDDLVARLIDALADTRRLGNTLFIFTSDNGFMYGEHRLPEGKDVVYEESIGVPLMMRGPGVPAGVARNGLVGNVDLAPTILDAADAAPGLVFDGRSLLPLAADPAFAWRDDLLIETRNEGTRGFVALRTESWLYSERYSGEESELYNLAADPFQLRSLHAEPVYESQRALMSERLRAVASCAGATCP